MVNRGKKILLILCAGCIFAQFNLVAKELSVDEISEKVDTFLSEYFIPDATFVDLQNIQEVDGKFLYKGKVKISRNKAAPAQIREFFITKDGELFFPTGIDIQKFIVRKREQERKKKEKISNIPQKNRSQVQLFVMSYCPYTLQIEKALFPVLELFEHKVDFKLRFVKYLLHGRKELEENLNQYCIQQEQKEKLTEYLQCFSREANTEYCLQESRIDQKKVASCKEQAKEEYDLDISESKKKGGTEFNLDKQLNQKYRVRGSPTFVINGVVIEPERSPEAIKDLICGTFKNKPQQCKQTLSSLVPFPGFEKREKGGSCTSSIK